MPAKRHTSGLTLLELMVTLAILAIVATIAVPSYQKTILQSQVKTGAQALFSDLLYARSEAIKRNENVTIAPNSGGWQQGWVVLTAAQVTSGEDYDSCETSPANCLSLQQPLDGVSVTFTSTGSNVVYESDGRVTNTATFEVCDADNTASITEREVSTSLTGRPSIESDGACS